MEPLFIKTPQGLLPVPDALCEKYKLEKGMYTPFSHYPVVDQTGDFTQKQSRHSSLMEKPDNNAMVFTTAETLDIASGEDSKQT